GQVAGLVGGLDTGPFCIGLDVPTSCVPGRVPVAHLEPYIEGRCVGTFAQGRGHVHQAQPQRLEQGACQTLPIGQQPQQGCVVRQVVEDDTGDQIPGEQVLVQGHVCGGRGRDDLLDDQFAAG